MAENKKNNASLRAILDRFYRPQMASFANRGFSSEESLNLTEETFLRFYQLQPLLAELIKRLVDQDPDASPPSATWVARELHAMAVDLGMVQQPPQRAESPDIGEEIERLYDRLAELTRHQTASGGATDDEIEHAFARLRALQKVEAEQYRARFEAGLKMPIDAGDKILARARALRTELEDLAAQDRATQDTDKPQASPSSR